MSRRTEMLGSTIQRELAEMIMRELNDPRLPTIVSITRVRVTEDLEYADVFVSIMGSEGQQLAALNALKHSAGMMRTKLTKTLSLRQSPFLRFQLDERLKKELEVLELLDKARRESAEMEQARAAKAAGSEETQPADEQEDRPESQDRLETQDHSLQEDRPLQEDHPQQDSRPAASS